MTTEDGQSTGRPEPVAPEATVSQEMAPAIPGAEELQAKPKKVKRILGYRIAAGIVILVVVCGVLVAALFGIALGLCDTEKTG